MLPFIIYAHRGASQDAPENTMAAFYAALRRGADGIECDIRLTKDGVPVIIHDSYLDRTTNGTGLISHVTYQELRRLEAAARVHPDHAGEKIPSLSNLFTWIKKTPLLLNLELKPVQAAEGVLEKEVLRLLGKHGLTNRTVISSYDPYSLYTIKQLQNEVKTALIYLYLDEPWQIAEEIGASALHPYYPFMTLELFYAIRERGFEILPYTVDHWSELDQLIRLGASGVITNTPSRARKILSLHQEEP